MFRLQIKSEVKEMEKEKVRKVVREGYARVAKRESSCCTPDSPCCGTTNVADQFNTKIGYTDAEVRSVPEGADLGLGCGNPVALASLKEGDIVLDLGSGAGFDCFLAANKVGNTGKVIGVDMTPEMLEKARENARNGNYENVEFRLGEIENLPVADNYVDVVLSNCVINLSPDKEKVFEEALRVLKPGGKLMVADIVILKELPDAIRNSVAAYIGCLSGATMRDEYVEAVRSAGFNEVRIIEETSFPVDCMANDPTAQALTNDSGIPETELRKIGNSVRSVKLCGVKPNETT